MAFFLAGLSVIPWSVVVLHLFPVKNSRKTALISGLSMLAGHFTTRVLLVLHPLLWPNTGAVVKKTHILTQTAHIAFIQAGMMEESLKIFFILLVSTILARKNNLWEKEVILAGSFVALGFSLSENVLYFSNTSDELLFSTFIARMIHSVNIHLLINICFALFLIKSNFKSNRFSYILSAFFLAVLQHGIVDFFLLPGSRIGNWLAAALFSGIWVWVVRDFREFVIQEKQSVFVQT